MLLIFNAKIKLCVCLNTPTCHKVFTTWIGWCWRWEGVSHFDFPRRDIFRPLKLVFFPHTLPHATFTLRLTMNATLGYEAEAPVLRKEKV